MGNLQKTEMIKDTNMKRTNLLGVSSSAIFNTSKEVLNSAFTTKSAADSFKRNVNADNLINDKYKHAFVSCKASQRGGVGAITAGAMGVGKEIYDQVKNKNTVGESFRDLSADAYGIYKGYTNPQGDCDEMVQRKYQKLIK